MKEELEQRKEALRMRFNSLVGPASISGKIYVGVHHLRQEIRLDYNQEDYKFAPGDFLIDEDNQGLALFVGIGKVMDDIHGEVPWFLFENSKEIKFFDERTLPKNLRKNLAVL